MVDKICAIISSNCFKLDQARVAARNAFNFLGTDKRFGISMKVLILIKTNLLVDLKAKVVYNIPL